MDIKLNHPSIMSRYNDVMSIFTYMGDTAAYKSENEIPTLDELVMVIKKVADGKDSDDEKNKCKGDIFEIFAEI